VFVDEGFVLFEGQGAYLATIEKISKSQVDHLLTLHEQASELGEQLQVKLNFKNPEFYAI